MVKFIDLNDRQQEAVTNESKHLRIIAGAGSGKTRVLTMRIAYLIEKLGVLPYNILAITFTNKAAREMKARINDMLGDNGVGCHISTIHSLCMRILSEDIEALNYPKNFSVIDQQDQHQILKEAYKLVGIDKKEYPYGVMLDYIANNKYEGISSLKALEYTYGEPRLKKKAEVYKYYDDRLKKMYALDFDDLILFTTRLFKTVPSKQEKWSKRFKYVHVDEFQDVDAEQYDLIKRLASYHDNLYVVGDPDQTIYTWRGADVNIIVSRLEEDYKDLYTITLNQNYRSTNNILSGANSLILNNKARIKKELFSKNGNGEKIIHKECMDETLEANYVVNEIMKLHKQGSSYKDIAVLYRSNYLSREIEKVLIENKVPYVIYGGLRFYERAEVKDILAYLKMITRSDDLSFLRIINVPRRGIGQKTIDSIKEIADANDITMYEVIKNGLFSKNQKSLDGFVNMIEGFKEDLKTLPLDLLLEKVLDKTLYRKMLEDENETERLENVKSLIDDIKEYIETYQESTLDEYLQMISLYTDKASFNETDAVNLCTIHSAKGLEFDNVFVIGMSEGIFPSDKSLKDGIKGLEEERRLAYVAYTRAKKLLYLTDTNGFSYVLQQAKTASRFINEIDEEYIKHIIDRPKNNSSLFDDEIPFARKSISIKPATLENSLIKNKNVSVPLRKGDEVIHKIFGEGVVLKVEGPLAEIAFKYPHGIKKMMANHPSMRKKTMKDFS